MDEMPVAAANHNFSALVLHEVIKRGGFDGGDKFGMQAARARAALLATGEDEVKRVFADS